MLASVDAAFCLADGPKLETPVRRTASWGYVRFHEGRANPHPCYGDQALGTWARNLAELYGNETDVYAFFNNDPRGCAVRDAGRLAGVARRNGLEPTRVPSRHEVHVAA